MFNKIVRADDLIQTYRQSINPPYKRKDLISILGTVFILLAIPLTVFVAVRVRPWGPRAAGTAASPTTIGSVLEPGSMVSGASYIVFVDGTNYYAKDGKTGEIKFSGTGDAAPVINAAINALPETGGKVLLSEGTFIISDTIHLTKNSIWLQGQGAGKSDAGSDGGTTIKLADGANRNMIDTNGNDLGYIKITDLRLYGNRANQTDTSHGLYLSVWKSWIERVVVENCFNNNYYFRDEKGGAGDNWVRSSRSDGAGEHGFRFDSVDTLIENCMSRDSGARIAGDNFLITSGGNKIYASKTGIGSRYGIYVIHTFDVAIVGSTIDSPAQHGIVVAGPAYGASGSLLIEGNLIRRPNQENGEYDGIKVAGDATNAVVGIRIIGNYIETTASGAGQPRYGIRIDSTATDTQVTNNYIGTCATAAISDAGTTSLIHHNKGYTTENSGTATINSGSSNVTVNHGLAKTPSAGDIMVTPTSPLGAASKFYVGNYTTDKFTIYLDQNPGVNVTFAWRAEVK